MNVLLSHFKEREKPPPKLCPIILFCIIQVAYNAISTLGNQNDTVLLQPHQRNRSRQRDSYSEAASLVAENAQAVLLDYSGPNADRETN